MHQRRRRQEAELEKQRRQAEAEDARRNSAEYLQVHTLHFISAQKRKLSLDKLLRRLHHVQPGQKSHGIQNNSPRASLRGAPSKVRVGRAACGRVRQR